MQEFFLKHKKRIIGAGIAILVLVTVIASGIKLNATLLESAIGVVVTPFQDLTTGISSWIDDTVTSARNKTKLKDENEELKQQIAELTNKNRKLSMYETENERLTALLKIAQKYPTYDSVGARVIAKDPGIWYDGFTINKGTTSSISANMVLIAPEGLVGKRRNLLQSAVHSGQPFLCACDERADGRFGRCQGQLQPCKPRSVQNGIYRRGRGNHGRRRNRNLSAFRYLPGGACHRQSTGNRDRHQRADEIRCD